VPAWKGGCPFFAISGRAYELYWEVDGEIVLRSANMNEEVEVVRDNRFTFRFYTPGPHNIAAHIVYKGRHLDLAATSITVAESNPYAIAAGSSESDQLVYRIHREHVYVNQGAKVAIAACFGKLVYERLLPDMPGQAGPEVEKIKDPHKGNTYTWDRRTRAGAPFPTNYRFEITAPLRGLEKRATVWGAPSVYLTKSDPWAAGQFPDALPDEVSVAIAQMKDQGETGGIKLWGAAGVQKLFPLFEVEDGKVKIVGWSLSNERDFEKEVCELEGEGWVRVRAKPDTTCEKTTDVTFTTEIMGVEVSRVITIRLARTNIVADVNGDSYYDAPDGSDEIGDIEPGLRLPVGPLWMEQRALGKDGHNVELRVEPAISSGEVEMVALLVDKTSQTGRISLRYIDSMNVVKPLRYTLVVGGVEEEVLGRIWVRDPKESYEFPLSDFDAIHDRIIVEGVLPGSTKLILAAVTRREPTVLWDELMVNIEVPRIDFIGPSNERIDPEAESLNVSNWVTTEFGLYGEGFEQTSHDCDNFRLEVETPATRETDVRVNLEIRRDGKLVARPTEYRLGYKSETRNIFRSEFVRLVTDAPDHAAEPDRTIKVQLGDEIRAKYVTGVNRELAVKEIMVGRPPGQGDNGPNQRRHDIRELKLHIVVFQKPDGSGPVVPRQIVEQDIATANERLAQAGLRVKVVNEAGMLGGNGDRGFPLPPSLVGGYVLGQYETVPETTPDGSRWRRRYHVALSEQENALVVGDKNYPKLMDEDPDSIDVFYVDRRKDGGGAHSYPARANRTRNASAMNFVVFPADPSVRYAYTLPHELMHILLNDEHRTIGVGYSADEPDVSLFFPSESKENTLDGAKRIGPFPYSNEAAADLVKQDTFVIRNSAFMLPK